MSWVDVRNYRRYAADCLELAGTLADGDERRRLVEMAASWHELAARIEEGQEPAASAARVARIKTVRMLRQRR